MGAVWPARETYFEIYLKIYLPNTVKYMNPVTGAAFCGAPHRGEARTFLHEPRFELSDRRASPCEPHAGD